MVGSRSLMVIFLYCTSTCSAWLMMSNSASQPSFTSAIYKVSYDGRSFSGWSAGNADIDESTVRTVESVLVRNLAKIYGNVDSQRIVMESCSRTDKGVHATSMVCLGYCLKQNYTEPATPIIPGKRLPHPMNGTDTTCFVPMRTNATDVAYKLNKMMPDSIKITQVALPPLDRVFHPTLDCRSKTYRYQVSCGPFCDPTESRRTWYAGRKQLNVPQMESAAAVLLGRHDFRAFKGAHRGKSDKAKQLNPICTLGHVSIAPHKTWLDTETLVIEITGDRFLYKMVRFLVGALVAVGKGSLTTKDIEGFLDSGVRDKPFECAPAHGLVLTTVEFDEELHWTEANT